MTLSLGAKLSWIVCWIGLASGKILDPCDLAQELRDIHRIPEADIDDWICLAYGESRYNTSAVGTLNADGSKDLGLFQISELWWCSWGKSGKACGRKCEDFIDDDITDDVKCAKRIFRAHEGFSAWVAWNQKCKGRDLSNYLANCGGAKPSENKGTNIKDLLAKVRPGIRAPTSKRKQKKKIAEPVHQ